MVDSCDQFSSTKGFSTPQNPIPPAEQETHDKISGSIHDDAMPLPRPRWRL